MMKFIKKLKTKHMIEIENLNLNLNLNLEGAYGHSMASNYNRIKKPAAAFAKDGKARIVIKRESYDDQLRLETDEEVIV